MGMEGFLGSTSPPAVPQNRPPLPSAGSPLMVVVVVVVVVDVDVVVVVVPAGIW